MRKDIVLDVMYDANYFHSATPRVSSMTDFSSALDRALSRPVRTGAIASFPNFFALERGFERVAENPPLLRHTREH